MLLLSGCSFIGSTELCCMQCSSDGEESLKCDNYNKAGECKSDGSLKCQGSARFFEHVLAKSDDAVNGYISAAGRYWDSGYREVARADMETRSGAQRLEL